MRMNIGKAVLCLAMFLAVQLNMGAQAQSYVRFVVPSDLGTKTLFSDDVLPSIILPKGVSRVDNNQQVRDAAFELMDILRDPSVKLLSVYVCGSASPEGLWQNNVKLSDARTSATAEYLRHVTGIPMGLIHEESLNEDWDRLYELVEASDIDYKEEVLYIIRTKDWGDRKTALQRLAGGRVWEVLLEDFFPQLRCVRIAFYCLWDESRPYMNKPAAPVKPEVARVDTVYVKDTVYYTKETVYVPQEQTSETDVYSDYREENNSRRPVHDTPWMMGFKTNLLTDAIVVPGVGVEFQIGNKFSLDLSGWYTGGPVQNILHPSEYTNAYSVSPELRWWFGNRTMQKGHFLGIHGNFAWYSIEWEKPDGTRILYQNGLAQNFADVENGLESPVWSAGLTYGYSLGFGRKGHWGLEFVAGLGYMKNVQNVGVWSEVPTPAWYFSHNESRSSFGLTKIGINLTYRFSFRKVKSEYYDR